VDPQTTLPTIAPAVSPAAQGALAAAAGAESAQQAAAVLQAAVAQARQTGDTAGLWRLLAAQAKRLRDRNAVQDALALWIEALDVCQRAGGTAAELATIEGSIAFSFIGLGLPDEAVDPASRAHERVRNLDVGDTRIRALNALALTQTRLGHHAQARASYREVVRLARGEPSGRRELWRAYINRGVSHAEEALMPDTAPAQAARLHRRAMRLNAVAMRLALNDADRVFSDLNDVEALIGLGLAGPAQTRLAQLHACLAGLPLDSGDLKLFQATALVLSGWVAGVAGDLALASQQLMAGIAALESLGFCEDLPRHLEVLSDVEERRGHFQQALVAARRASRLRLTMARSQSEARLPAIEVRQGLDAARRSIEAERQRAHLIEVQRVALMDQALRLTEAARTDALTGLGNRRLLMELAGSLNNPAGAASPMAVVALDLDHFKAVNDRFSHAVGDLVLVAVARILREHCRPQDAVVRMGGEEFALVLVGMPEDSAALVCERLRAAVATHDWTAVRPGLLQTVSLGLEACQTPLDLDAALALADTRLYRAKREGRNRVCAAG
jgi:diguanylate cyclase (GGDEF)-like protein